jgi:cation transport regulator ChaC
MEGLAESTTTTTKTTTEATQATATMNGGDNNKHQTTNNKNTNTSPPPCHSKKKKKQVHHFVFGYGSLICPDSRRITNPSLASKPPLPVVVHDVERVWSARTESGYTAMGVQFQLGAECTGILLEVNESQLRDLDQREANYKRLPIQLENIQQVPFLDEDEYYDDQHVVFEAKQDEKLEERVKVWIYMQKDPISADPSHPIPQSYVDIIIRVRTYYL